MGEKILSSYLLTNTPEQTITGKLTVTGTVSKPVTVNTYIVQGMLNGNQSIPNSSDTIIQFMVGGRMIGQWEINKSFSHYDK